MALHVNHKKKRSSHGSLTQTKAKKILRDGTVHGKSLTAKQRRFFGARAGDAPMKRAG